jgi:hypothetical protein
MFLGANSRDNASKLTLVQLTARLSAHEVANSRSFSTAIQDSKRPVAEPANPGKPVRHFNTSRSLKAVGDSSTIDFAYLPDFDPDTKKSPVIRVPILPQTVLPESHRVATESKVEETVSVNLIPTLVLR